MESNPPTHQHIYGTLVFFGKWWFFNIYDALHVFPGVSKSWYRDHRQHPKETQWGFTFFFGNSWKASRSYKSNTGVTGFSYILAELSRQVEDMILFDAIQRPIDSGGETEILKHYREQWWRARGGAAEEAGGKVAGSAGRPAFYSYASRPPSASIPRLGSCHLTAGARRREKREQKTQDVMHRLSFFLCPPRTGDFFWCPQ